MATKKYNFLDSFKEDNFLRVSADYVCKEGGYYGNVFRNVSHDEIDRAEKKIGTKLPAQLLEFYTEIGSGQLRAPYNCSSNYEFLGTNEILPPYAAAEFFKPLENDSRPADQPLSTEDEEYWMSDSTYEDIQPGDMPFFEISDGSKFLVMRPHSKTPNVIWSDTGVKIEDSFEKFIWRLYYESPVFYDEIIVAYYEALEQNK